jgi:hypothetical protein
MVAAVARFDYDCRSSVNSFARGGQQVAPSGSTGTMGSDYPGKVLISGLFWYGQFIGR